MYKIKVDKGMLLELEINGNLTTVRFAPHGASELKSLCFKSTQLLIKVRPARGE